MKKAVAVLLAVVLVAFSVVTAFAVDSPSGKFRYKVVVIPTEGGTGGWQFTSDIDENAEQGVRLYPEPYDGYTFDHWEIKGLFRHENYDFDIVHLGASVNSMLLAAVAAADAGAERGTMDMMIHSDIYAYPYYVKDGKIAGKVANKDTGSTSPQTGSSDVVPYIVIAFSAVALASAGVLVIRSAKKSK